RGRRPAAAELPACPGARAAGHAGIRRRQRDHPRLPAGRRACGGGGGGARRAELTDRAGAKGMSGEVTAGELRRWLHGEGEGELALLDVREPGQIAEGHILFSAPLPYSRFEIDLPRLAPNPRVRMVLCDAGDGVAARAATRARAMGYTHVHVL